MLIDTHTHLYLEEFDKDRDEVVIRSIESGVEKLFLPNIDLSSVENMLQMSERYPKHCYPMLGLHPGSVKKDYLTELEKLESYLGKGKFIAIGEIGIDLYWDKSLLAEQEQAFEIQLKWAKDLSLPVVIHARDSFQEIFKILDKMYVPGMKGVFHSFTGTKEDAKKIKEYDFYYGINGIATYKNSALPEVIKTLPADRILLETDSPFLSPVPKRGKRNESSFLQHTCQKLSEILNINSDKIEELTTTNALQLFRIEA
ncbi:MAG: TatD family hydrolase [Bacteroidales bacterium]|nr:TatD family hydrolase [Bacteroidales bacterium]MCF8391168.1 TatD family hydrolase [Bacteroidales bacterium]